jgi:alpha-D-xyloside xylohydrolase
MTIFAENLNTLKMIIKKLLLLGIILMASAAYCMAEGFEFSTGKYCCKVEFYSPTIVRVTKWPANKAFKEEKSLVVTMQPQQGLKVSRKENATSATLNCGNLAVKIDKRSGRLQFLGSGKNLLHEKSFKFEERTEGADKGSYKVNQTYTLDKQEAIYGLGTIQDGKLNRRGTSIFMEQSNLQDFQYVLQSVKGWGIYWDNYSRAQFDDNAEGMSFTAEVGDAVDYYFMYGGSIDGVNRQMRELSGQVPMFPLWTFGYFQSKERYKSAQEVLDVVNHYRKLQVPLDCIVQDWQYWGSNYTWNAMDFLGEPFEQGKQMIDNLHGMNAKLMISIWASFGPNTLAYKELDKKGLLFDFQTWPQSGLSFWPPRMDYPSGVRVYDAYSEEARNIYWKNLKRLFDYGVDAWWMDSTDPDCFYPKESDYEHITGLGSWRKVRNAFPLCTVSGVYDKQRATSDKQRVFIMTRSAFAGQQRYGSGLWSGDVNSSWDMLRKQMPLGQNYSMTGCPNFNTDIGGFFCGSYNTKGAGSAPQNPQYQELYVRWMQYGFFCPVFRSHGADAPREIWQFGKKGEPIYDAIEKTIRMRYQFLPYIYSTAWQVTSAGESYIRPLVSDFASDKNVWNMGNEFMFGSSLLAAPIDKAQYTDEKVIKTDAMTGWNKDNNIEEGRNNKTIDFTVEKTIKKYLPKGASWYDFFTEKLYQGGKAYTLSTTIDHTPMFVKAGSILPLAPITQYANMRAWDNLELRVYPGANAKFTLYEDEGDNYNYENGAYTTIQLTWNEKARSLTIGERKGSFKGMLQKRKFTIRLVNGETKTVEYSGNEIVIKL